MGYFVVDKGENAKVYVRYQCDCIAEIADQRSLQIRCPQHNTAIKDWASVYRSPQRVVIHWLDGQARFALHKVDYDQYGFPLIHQDKLTKLCDTTAELAQEAHNMGLDMTAVSNIFYDRYIEYQESFTEE